MLPRLLIGGNPIFNRLMSTKAISLEKMEVIKNLYLSGIGEEFIALQLDIEIPVVIKVLKEQGIYSGSG